MFSLGKPIWPDRPFRDTVLLALLQSGIPFVLLPYAALTLNASTLSILHATLPLLVLIFANLAGLDRISPSRVLTIAVGMTGVVLVVGWSAVDPTPKVLVAAACSLASSASFAAAIVYAKRRFVGVSPYTAASSQLVVATVVLLPFALLHLPEAPPTPTHVANAAALAIVGTAVAFIMYYWLIEKAGSMAAASVHYLIPLSGVLLGSWLLSEPLTGIQLVGLCAILLSVASLNAPQWFARNALAPRTQQSSQSKR
jgi:drug/metabolite transporter (DMT)-like permease